MAKGFCKGPHFFFLGSPGAEPFHQLRHNINGPASCKEAQSFAREHSGALILPVEESCPLFLLEFSFIE